jgi:hypothetical protein
VSRRININGRHGVAALLDGLLPGISIMARDGVPRGTIDAAISSAFHDWRSNP